MSRIGIGVVTYNRRDVLAATVDRVHRLTRHLDVEFVVADDGSTDGTLDWLRDNDVPVIRGVNMDVAWNKNRALYLLAEIRGCEAVILLEDDTQPNKPGWEAEWIEAARLWGHANFAEPRLAEHFVSGAGTAADPFRSVHFTAQCSVFSRESLLYGGFYDSRFRGYGHEHVEHTRRLVRVGFGGTERWVDGAEEVRYVLLTGDLTVAPVASFQDAEQVERNLQIAQALMGEQGYRAPWRDDKELKQFRAEIAGALEARPQGFALHGAGGAEMKGWRSALQGWLGAGLVRVKIAIEYENTRFPYFVKPKVVIVGSAIHLIPSGNGSKHATSAGGTE